MIALFYMFLFYYNNFNMSCNSLVEQLPSVFLLMFSLFVCFSSKKLFQQNFFYSCRFLGAVFGNQKY